MDGRNNSNMQPHQVICAGLKHKLQINCKGLFSSFFLLLLLLLQSSADLHLLNGLLSVTSVFWPVFLVLNFAFINICSYRVLPSVFGRPFTQLPWGLLSNTWHTFPLLSILLTWPIQFILFWQMKVYLNLQTAALIVNCISVSNFIYCNSLKHCFLSKVASFLLIYFFIV